MKIWEVTYEELPSNDKSESGWIEDTTLTIAAKTAEIAIEKARKYALRPGNTWYECDDEGNETDKKVRVVGFRLRGLKLKETVDL